jgi:multicomponent Na+:H+ antiporter subunit D
MGIAALACILIGLFPRFLYGLLPWPVDYSPYDFSHVLAQLQLLFFSALAFAWLNLQGLYPPELRSVNLDSDWIYRRLAPGIFGFCERALKAVTAIVKVQTLLWAEFFQAWVARQRGSDSLQSLLSRSGMLVWVALMLVVFVVFSRY